MHDLSRRSQPRRPGTVAMTAAGSRAPHRPAIRSGRPWVALALLASAQLMLVWTWPWLTWRCRTSARPCTCTAANCRGWWRSTPCSSAGLCAAAVRPSGHDLPWPARSV